MDLTLSDLDGARKLFLDLPTDWQLSAFVDELDRVETVAARRERLAAALSEASAALVTELLSEPVDVDAAVICRQRKTALGDLLADAPAATIGYEALLPVATDVHARLASVIPPDSNSLPALSYTNELAQFGSNYGGGDAGEPPPIRLLEDAAAQTAIDTARVRFASWAAAVQGTRDAAATATNLLAWLSAARELMTEIESQAPPLLAEVRALIVAANAARVEQGVVWRSSWRHAEPNTGARYLDLVPTLHASAPPPAMAAPPVAVPVSSPFN